MTGSTKQSKTEGWIASSLALLAMTEWRDSSSPRLYFQRHRRFIFRVVQHERRPDVAHMRRGREMRDEILKRRHVGRDAFQDEVDFARQHPAFPHERFGADESFERLQVRLRLARQVHRSKHRHVEAEPARVQQAAVTLDVARLFERTYTAQAGRRGDADA